MHTVKITPEPDAVLAQRRGECMEELTALSVDHWGKRRAELPFCPTCGDALTVYGQSRGTTLYEHRCRVTVRYLHDEERGVAL